MKKTTRIVIGCALIAVGVVYTLNALNILHVSLFFDGWWTLFILVPCAVGLFTEEDKWGNIIGLLVGTLLLLCCQDVLAWSMLWKLLVPGVIILIGCRLLFAGLFGGKGQDLLKRVRANGQLKGGTAVFGGANMNFTGKPFYGAELNALFGGVKCDLRGAEITGDCGITANALFGGIDIMVPDDVAVKVVSASLFGGVSEKKKTTPPPDAHTLYINANCLFGGVDIK